MIRTLAIAAGLVLGATALPMGLRAQSSQTPAKPLRTLVYSVTFSVRTVNEESTSGFRETGAALYGNATTKRSATVDDSGTLTANVVGFSADGGLAVDASFAGKSATQPPVRVAIFREGALSYAPGAELAPEVARILPLLARGVVAERDISIGSTWTIPAAPPAKGASTYHVIAVSGDMATFGIDIDISMPGPKGFDEHGKATAVYDTARLCPTRYEFTATSRHQPAMDQYVTSNARLTATLVSDSFAKR